MKNDTDRAPGGPDLQVAPTHPADQLNCRLLSPEEWICVLRLARSSSVAARRSRLCGIARSRDQDLIKENAVQNNAVVPVLFLSTLSAALVWGALLRSAEPGPYEDSHARLDWEHIRLDDRQILVPGLAAPRLGPLGDKLAAWLELCPRLVPSCMASISTGGCKTGASHRHSPSPCKPAAQLRGV